MGGRQTVIRSCSLSPCNQWTLQNTLTLRASNFSTHFFSFTLPNNRAAAYYSVLKCSDCTSIRVLTFPDQIDKDCGISCGSPFLTNINGSPSRFIGCYWHIFDLSSHYIISIYLHLHSNFKILRVTSFSSPLFPLHVLLLVIYWFLFL